MFFNHWKLIKKNHWPFKYFTPYELASNGNGSLLINYDAITKLELVRMLLDKPIIINSAYRDDLYNSLIGGSPLSYHTEGKAFDISLKNQNKDNLISICKEVGFTGLGVNYTNFLHIDTGYKRSW
jgi:uncharacterized protein YcbK (DUF882 family)